MIKDILKTGPLGFSLENKMIIKLENQEKKDINAEPYFTTVVNIMTAYKEGKHIVIAEAKFFEEIRNNNNFDERIRNAAMRAENEQRQYHQLLKGVNTYIHVELGNLRSNYKKNEDNGIEKIVVSCDFFKDSSSIQKINLLCEDLSDADLYLKMGDFYKHNINLSTTNILFDYIGGGGDNTYKSFSNITENTKFCLCLLDSDKKHPNGKQGGTSLKFKDKKIPFNGKYIVINAHEAECLIPNEIIELLILDRNLNHYNYDFHTRLDYLREICQSNSLVKLYFDHKEGLTVNNIKKFDKSGDTPFWENAVKGATGLKRRKCAINFHCDCKESASKKNQQECYIILGFGSKLLEDSSAKINQMPTPKIKHMLKGPLLTEWMNIGREIFSWGCAPSKVARTS